MQDEQPLSAAQKAQMATQIGELDQQIAALDGQLRTTEQQLAQAKAKQQPPLQSRLSALQQERSSLLQQANTMRAHLGLPMVIPTTPQHQDGAHIYPGTPRPAKQDNRKGCLSTIAILAVLFVVVLSLENRKASPSTASTGATGQGNNAPAVPAGPPDEVEFVRTVESYYPLYSAADNDLKKSSLRVDRKQAVATLVPSHTATNWTGTLGTLGTNSDGKAYVTIVLDGATKLGVKTWNNALSDSGSDTLIANGSPLYNKIAAMSKGAHVVFSGQFISDPDKDFVKESSMTEDGSMTAPEYIMKFTDVTAK